MSKHPCADVFLESLSVSGEKGILRGRLGDAPCRGRIRAKTGFLKGVSCLSGFLDRADGSHIVLSILTNFPPAEGAYSRIKAQDDICRAVLCAPRLR